MPETRVCFLPLDTHCQIHMPDTGRQIRTVLGISFYLILLLGKFEAKILIQSQFTTPYLELCSKISAGGGGGGGGKDVLFNTGELSQS